MFYGRVGDVYMGVITLTVTLILFKFANSTAGEQWRVGAAALGGFNGIPQMPPLNWPGDPANPLTPEQVFVVSVLCLFGCYAAVKLILLTRFGRVAVAIKENMQFIRAIARTVTVFHQGRVLVQDSADRVLADPQVRDVYLGRAAA